MSDFYYDAFCLTDLQEFCYFIEWAMGTYTIKVTRNTKEALFYGTLLNRQPEPSVQWKHSGSNNWVPLRDADAAAAVDSIHLGIVETSVDQSTQTNCPKQKFWLDFRHSRIFITPAASDDGTMTKTANNGRFGAIVYNGCPVLRCLSIMLWESVSVPGWCFVYIILKRAAVSCCQ